MKLSWPNLLLGAFLGAPVGFFTNYVYDQLFPAVVSVDIQPVGVQQLNVPVANYSGYGLDDETSNNGSIEIWYAEGTATSNYSCGFSVSHKDIFEFVRMVDKCKKIEFAFLPPSQMPSKYTEVDVDIIFDVWVESPTGNRWRGSTSVYFFFIR